MSYLLAHGPQVAVLTLQHVGLVFAGLGIALVIALPLGIFAARVQRMAAPLFGVLAAVYAIPSLALLALFVEYFGLGAAPVIIVLAAYAQFILVRNIAAA